MRDKHAVVARHLFIICFAVAIVGVAVTSARVPISPELERYLVETNIPGDVPISVEIRVAGIAG